MTIKITGLTSDQARVAREYLTDPDFVVTKTTVTFVGPDAVLKFAAILNGTSGRGYPRQPLLSIRRKYLAQITRETARA